MSQSKGSGWVDAYVERSAERVAQAGNKPHLHQTAGWYDIADLSEWRAYVRDAVEGYVAPGARVFEAGCGVLAFLAEVRELQPSVSLHGVDGSETSIRVVHDEVAPALGLDPTAFRTGLLPGALHGEPEDSYDLVLCNSVLQYLPEADGFASADAMLRMTRPGGTVLLADICDAAFVAEEEPKLASFWQGYGEALPRYTYFHEAQWQRYAERARVVVRRSTVESYRRRRSRYLVYLTKH